MKVMLTSSIGGQAKVDGKRVPTKLMERNALVAPLKKNLTQNAKVNII